MVTSRRNIREYPVTATFTFDMFHQQLCVHRAHCADGGRRSHIRVSLQPLGC